MLIVAVLCGSVGLVIGIIIERYKWVGRCKKGQAVEVDGELYKVHKIVLEEDDV